MAAGRPDPPVRLPPGWLTPGDHDRYFLPFCRQAIPDDLWYRRRVSVEYHRPIGIDHYVKALYRHYGMASRAELLARVFCRPAVRDS